MMDNMLRKTYIELHELMQEVQIPLYMASGLRYSDDEEDSTVSSNRPLIFSSVESACRALSAMADYHAYLSAED
jgi:hypothetical protein